MAFLEVAATERSGPMAKGFSGGWDLRRWAWICLSWLRVLHFCERETRLTVF